jgi:hypothetical protein
MSQSEETKTGLIFIQVIFYIVGVATLVFLTIEGYSKSTFYNKSDFYFSLTLSYLIGVPIIQYVYSRILKSSGKLQSAKSIIKAIQIEIFLIFFILVALFGHK